MTMRNLQRQAPWLILAGVAVLLFSFLTIVPVNARPAAQETEKFCLSCHGDSTLSMTLPSGEEVSLYVSQDELDHSVHSNKGIECEACHNDISGYPPYHSKYNPVERCWGILEKHWNGARLTDTRTMLE